MLPDESQPKVNTRLLPVPAESAPTVPSQTGPLDLKRPWVIEFRVVGTASTLKVRVGETMMIGRSDAQSGFAPEVDLTPFDAFGKGVSRKHALITIKEQRLMIRDLNSTNGTRLNNAPCVPGEEYRLRHGNELVLGTLKLQVSFAVVPALTDTQRVASRKDAVESLLQSWSQPINVGTGKQLLVIEDDPDVGSVFRSALEAAGHKVVLVNDVTRALGVVFQGMPDAIILDGMLPDMNSLDLVRYVRKQKLQKHVPILVVSDAKAGYQMNQVLNAGADAFLGKPIAVEELVLAVSRVINGLPVKQATAAAPAPASSAGAGAASAT